MATIARPGLGKTHETVALVDCVVRRSLGDCDLAVSAPADRIRINHRRFRRGNRLLVRFGPRDLRAAQEPAESVAFSHYPWPLCDILDHWNGCRLGCSTIGPAIATPTTAPVTLLVTSEARIAPSLKNAFASTSVADISTPDMGAAAVRAHCHGGLLVCRHEEGSGNLTSLTCAAVLTD